MTKKEWYEICQGLSQQISTRSWRQDKQEREQLVANVLATPDGQELLQVGKQMRVAQHRHGQLCDQLGLYYNDYSMEYGPRDFRSSGDIMGCVFHQELGELTSTLVFASRKEILAAKKAFVERWQQALKQPIDVGDVVE